MNELVDRVGRNIRERGLLQPGQRVLVGVSGGLDSMVLLRVLHELSRDAGWKLTVGHFNHQLRGRSSEADERFVRRAAQALGLPFRAESADVRQFGRRHKVSLEMAARQLRHEFLARAARGLSISVVALAHHADDQLELFFLRLLRGSGGEGLSGMKWRNPSPADSRILLARPLLDVPKAALADYAARAKVAFREDASNARLDIQRNRIRHELLPLLRRYYQPALERTILRVMSIVGEEAEFASQAAERWLSAAGQRGGGGRSRARMEDGEWRMEDGGWKGERGKWQSGEGGSIKASMEDGEWRMEDGRRKGERGKRDGGKWGASTSNCGGALGPGTGAGMGRRAGVLDCGAPAPLSVAPTAWTKSARGLAQSKTLRSSDDSRKGRKVARGTEGREAAGAGTVPTFGELAVAVQRRCIQQQLRELEVAADFELVEQLRAQAGVPVTVGAARRTGQRGRAAAEAETHSRVPGRQAVAGPRRVLREENGLVRWEQAEAARFRREALELDLEGGGEAVFAGVKLAWRTTRAPHQRARRAGRELYDAERVGRRIVVRHWQPGDRFQPLGLPGPVKLQDFFTNQKVLRPRRHELIIGTTAQGEVFWVEGARMGERFKLTAQTKRCLHWRWQRV